MDNDFEMERVQVAPLFQLTWTAVRSWGLARHAVCLRLIAKMMLNIYFNSKVAEITGI